MSFVSYNSNTTGVTWGAGTVALPEYLSSSLGSCCSIFSFLCFVLYIIVYRFVPCLLAIILSVVFNSRLLIAHLVSAKFYYAIKRHVDAMTMALYKTNMLS